MSLTKIVFQLLMRRIRQKIEDPEVPLVTADPPGRQCWRQIESETCSEVKYRFNKPGASQSQRWCRSGVSNVVSSVQENDFKKVKMMTYKCWMFSVTAGRLEPSPRISKNI